MDIISHSKPWLGEAELHALQHVLAGGMLLDGDNAPRFRHEIARISGATSVHLMPSGRLAISLALRSLNLKPGAGVVVQSYACNALVWAIRHAGLTPVFCDIGTGWVATVDTVDEQIDPSIGAIILAPPFGLLQSAQPFRSFGLPIVHDLCQASPSAVSSVPPDQLGDVVILSFHPIKYVCAGGGGAVLCFGDRWRVDDLDRFASEVQHYAPLDELRASIGVTQLARLGDFAGRRRAIAESFFAALPSAATAKLADQLDVARDLLFRFPLRIEGLDFNTTAEELKMRGVIVRRGVDELCHRTAGLSDADYENTLRAFNETLSIPFYPALTDDDVGRVSESVAPALRR